MTMANVAMVIKPGRLQTPGAIAAFRLQTSCCDVRLTHMNTDSLHTFQSVPHLSKTRNGQQHRRQAACITNPASSGRTDSDKRRRCNSDKQAAGIIDAGIFGAHRHAASP